LSSQEPSRRKARIAFATVVPIGGEQLSFFDPSASLVEAIRPATQVERYNRIWRMGQIRRGGPWISGRIGYETIGGPAQLWSEELQDFEEVSLLEGRTSPFAVHLPTRHVAFQLRMPQIKPRTFTGAFQALLNEASVAFRWRVIEEIIEVSWPEWRQSVERVIALRFALARPNPNYGNRQQLRQLIEDGNAEMVKTIMRANPEDLDGLNVDSEFVRESIEHVSEGYGNFAADGEAVEEGEAYLTSWSSAQGGTPVQRTVELDPDSPEVVDEDLQHALAELGISEDLEHPIPPIDLGPVDRRRHPYDESAVRGRLEDEMLEVDEQGE
jgi:hypothetical protein